MKTESNLDYRDREYIIWSTARLHVRDIIEAAKTRDCFEKGGMAYVYASALFVDLLLFLKDEKIIEEWDAVALTDLLDSMCEK